MNYRHLTQEQRYQIQGLLRAGFSNRSIAVEIRCHPSTAARQRPTEADLDTHHLAVDRGGCAGLGPGGVGQLAAANRRWTDQPLRRCVGDRSAGGERDRARGDIANHHALGNEHAVR